MFILICRYNRVFAFPGDDIMLSSHLSPETSAVAMEVRWFRGIECIYLYKNGQVSIGRGYEGRASLQTLELKSGNVSLNLKSITPTDTGIYTCQVLTGHNKVEKSIHLYMSGMEPLSPDTTVPQLTEHDAVDKDESVLILELKKLLQQRDKELEAKTKELEATNEMLRTKSSLLLYRDLDLENINKLASQKEEQLKNVVSELEMCKKKLETLGQKLDEKGNETQVEEHQEQQIADGLKAVPQDTVDSKESVHLLELRNLLQKREKELEDRTKQLESTSEELTSMAKLLQDRGVDVENLAKERDEYLKSVTAEMELCFKELETLGQKLQEKSTEVKKLQVILQNKERELQEEKDRQGERERSITVNKTVGISNAPLLYELVEKSHNTLSRMCQNPKEQVKDIESWIYKKREERRQCEEEERTKVLENEFMDYISAVKELIGKKHEMIVAWAKMKTVLEKKLEVVEADEEREGLEIQLKEALEMQRQGKEQIQFLTEDMEEKRRGIEEKHQHEIEEIREKYSAMSRIEADTNILQIILPDVQAYFQNIATSLQSTLDAQRQIIADEDAKKRCSQDCTSIDREDINVAIEILENQTNSATEEEVTLGVIKRSPEINNNMEHEDAEEDQSVAREVNNLSDTDSELDSHYRVNSEITEKREIKEEEQEEMRAVNEHVETGEDMVNTV